MPVPDFFVKQRSSVPDFFVKSSDRAKPVDTKSTEGLVAVAERAGLGDEAREIAQPEQQLSLLQRMIAGLGAFNPAEAVMRNVEGKGVFPLEYAKTVAGGLASAVTGNADYNEGRRTFANAVEKLPRASDSEHVTNLPGPLPNIIGGLEGAGRYIAGTGLDIGLDPTTYLGGTMTKGALNAGAKVLGAVDSVAPKAISDAVKVGGAKVGDSLGKLFSYGHGTSKGVPEKMLEAQGAMSKAKEAVVDENRAKFLDDLTDDDRAEFTRRMFDGKRLENKLRERAVREEKRTMQKAMDDANAEASRRAINLEVGVRDLADVSREGRGVAATGARTLDNSLTGADVRLGTAHELTDDVLDAEARAAVRLKGSTQQAKKAAVETAMTGSKAERRALRRDLASGQGIPALSPQQLGITDAIEHHARRIAGLRPTEPLTDVVKKTIERTRDFARKSSIEDPMAVYFPSLKNETTKIAAFLEGTSGLRQGSKGYKKKFNDLLKDEELVRNPAEAYAKREYEMLRDRIISQTQKDIVRDSGLAYNAFKNTDEAAKAGYSLIKENGMYGKPVGWIKNADKEFVDSITASGPLEKGWDELARVTGYDAVQSLFKRSVTSPFAAFHVRNYLSGHMQNFEVLGAAALRPRNLADGHRMALALAKPEKAKGMTVALRGGKKVPMELAMKPFEKRFGSSSQYIADIADATGVDDPSWLGKIMGDTGQMVKQGPAITRKLGAKVEQLGESIGGKTGRVTSKVGEAVKDVKSLNPLNAENPVFRGGRAVGNFIETQQKATAYLTALRKGKSVDEALELATRAGFDYRALTKFESKVMRRLVPFYSFTRKNAVLQLRTLGESPERINQIMASLNNFGDRPDASERRALPDYMQGQFATKLPDTEAGRKQYMSGYGTPIEAFADTLDTRRNFFAQKGGMLGPVPKLGVELATGKDLFRQKDIKDVFDAEEYRMMPDTVKKWMNLRERQEPIRKMVNGKWKETGKTRTVYAADPERLHLIRQLPTSRLVNTISKAMDKDVSTGVKLVTFFTGLKPQQIDLDAVARATDKERRRQLQDLLERYGAGYTAERFVARKPQK